MTAAVNSEDTVLSHSNVEQALRVLDAAREDLLMKGEAQTGLLKENFRRDALSVNRAAEILESYLSNRVVK